MLFTHHKIRFYTYRWVALLNGHCSMVSVRPLTSGLASNSYLQAVDVQAAAAQ